MTSVMDLVIKKNTKTVDRTFHPRGSVSKTAVPRCKNGGGGLSPVRQDHRVLTPQVTPLGKSPPPSEMPAEATGNHRMG